MFVNSGKGQQSSLTLPELPMAKNKQSGCTVVAIATKLLSERLDSSVIVFKEESGRLSASEKRRERTSCIRGTRSQKIRSKERARATSECESKGKENRVRVRLR